MRPLPSSNRRPTKNQGTIHHPLDLGMTVSSHHCEACHTMGGGCWLTCMIAGRGCLGEPRRSMPSQESWLTRVTLLAVRSYGSSVHPAGLPAESTHGPVVLEATPHPGERVRLEFG